MLYDTSRVRAPLLRGHSLRSRCASLGKAPSSRRMHSRSARNLHGLPASECRHAFVRTGTQPGVHGWQTGVHGATGQRAAAIMTLCRVCTSGHDDGGLWACRKVLQSPTQERVHADSQQNRQPEVRARIIAKNGRARCIAEASGQRPSHAWVFTCSLQMRCGRQQRGKRRRVSGRKNADGAGVHSVQMKSVRRRPCAAGWPCRSGHERSSRQTAAQRQVEVHADTLPNTTCRSNAADA